MQCIARLLRHDTAGDPMTGLKWTHRTTRKIASALGDLGIDVCPRTVARLLEKLGYRLRVNHKKVARKSPEGRDAQFRVRHAAMRSSTGRGARDTVARGDIDIARAAHELDEAVVIASLASG
jgi:hypothetical protein